MDRLAETDNSNLLEWVMGAFMSIKVLYGRSIDVTQQAEEMFSICL